MRVCRFRGADGSVRVGLESEGHVFPMHPTTDGRPMRIQDVLQLEPREFAECSQRALESPVESDYHLLAPVPHPEKIICVGLNYRDHALETGKQPPSEPVIFAKLSSSIIGPHDPIILPALSDRVDFEAELVVVIGRTCRAVSETEAMNYVFGYTCGHDVSARDWQLERPGGQWLLGKSFDTFAPLGPYLVPKSQVPDPGNLRIRMLIGEQVFQDSSTSELIFSIPHLISYLSQIFTLKPGDLLFTGTPAGVGVARKPPRFLAPGDVCTVEIESLGQLTNPVVAHDSPQAAEYWLSHEV